MREGAGEHGPQKLTRHPSLLHRLHPHASQGDTSPLPCLHLPQAQERGHPDESGERRGLHLLHDPGAVCLDGLFGRPQRRGDILVRHPGNHQAQDFPLPRGQRGEALTHRRLVALAVPRPRVLLQDGRDGGQEGLVVHGLLEEIDGPRLHRPDTQGDGPIAGEEDDRQATRVRPEGLLHQQAVLPCEPHIQDEAGRAV